MLLLMLAAIWGIAFVAQKTAMGGLGPLSFVAVRFIVAALATLPFAIREARRLESGGASPVKLMMAGLAPGLAMALGLDLQQIGIATTSVANAAFLTGVYVVLAPFLLWLLRNQPPTLRIWAAALASLAGTWLLTGANAGGFTRGDAWVLASSAFWALQMVLLGPAVTRTGQPMAIAVVQMGIAAALSLTLALMFEPVSLADIAAQWRELAFTGLMSGAFCFAMQAVALRYTTAAEAAVMTSAELPFAALAGIVVLGERLNPPALTGCLLILTAILIVQLGKAER